ncbi:MAG TPA: hypothetical protein VFT85_00780 [Acidimicrobiia bacterium]|nr:hypothetical protein [Acidimicrobiia bacterium]
MTSRRPRLVALGILAMAVAGCGGSPLESLGLRSSEWINEPTVPTTVAVVTTTPVVVPAEGLQWANDEIETADLDDQAAVLAGVFARREGDRFIQASRSEIAAALPELAFPGVVPSAAQWVSSQLVFDNDGTLALDPTVAFGIWSAEPYSRSRSVAQMMVLRVATDPVAADEVASGQGELSCARFSDRSTQQCEMSTIDDRPTWVLDAASGATVIWFEGQYRYELFGRSFVPLDVLQDMVADMEPLGSFVEEPS